jgi:hypothetical protein
MTLATATDAGNGYGARGCAAEGCGAILAYPDEGATCVDHTCRVCGKVVEHIDRFSVSWRDSDGVVYLDDSATSCLRCFAAIMETLSPYAVLRVGYKRERRG